MANLDEAEDIPSAVGRSYPTSQPHKSHGRAVLARANKTQRKTTESGTENESSDDEVADDEDGDEALDLDEDDDGDDESDQPAAFAPPRGHRKLILRKAGRLAEYRRMFHSEDPVLYEDPQDLFGGSIEDDDELYQAVDDISDEDEQSDEMFQLNGDDDTVAASFLHEQAESPFCLPDHELEADFILGQVDGLSPYGFGDDLDTGDGSGEFSAQSDDGDIPAIAERHVHFGSDIEHMNAYAKSTSPSFTRALLPSAMPFEHDSPIYGLRATHQTFKTKASVEAEEAYDSMWLGCHKFPRLLIHFDR
jgi:hypothetical protein